MKVCSGFFFLSLLILSQLVLRETLEDIRQGEGAESWTEVIAHMHFYPDLHGLFYVSSTECRL